MAIDPWIYVSGAPPAASPTPYRANSKVQSGQGFASFLRASFDQAMAEDAPSQPSVKHQTSSGAPVLRGKVDLGARPVFASEPQAGQATAAKPENGQVSAMKAHAGHVNVAKSENGQAMAAKSQAGQATAAKPENGQVSSAKAQAEHVSAAKEQSGQSATVKAQAGHVNVAKSENGQATAAKSQAEQAAAVKAESGRSRGGESNIEMASAPERAVSVGAEQPSEGVTSPLTAEEESVLRAVAALQARSVKTSTRAHRHSTDKNAKGSADALATTDVGLGGSSPMEADLETLTKTAKSQVGRRYVRGGDSPKSGFDCSGFTNWVYGESGVDIARNSRAQFREGTPVSRDKLQKGDLVFFGSKKRVHHVGMYLGDGQFIHSASTGRAVRISSLDNPFWSRTYAGARRMVVQSAAKESHKPG